MIYIGDRVYNFILERHPCPDPWRRFGWLSVYRSETMTQMRGQRISRFVCWRLDGTVCFYLWFFGFKWRLWGD